jgi:CubicO group peptidase (beta-lactamase class C family)
MSGADERRTRVEAWLRQEPLLHPRESATTTIERAMARHRVPGCSVAVINGGRVEWERGYGVTEAGGATPVRADTIFQACSISKAVAATAALRLVQAGRLDLDEDINAYLTTWQLPANGAWRALVTLRHLLSHTAGLTYCWFPGHNRGAPLPTTLQTLRGAFPANTPPVRATAIPGTQFRYSGAHYAVVQQLLMDVTGQPFEDLLREVVFAPLGMHDSGYETDFPARHSGSTAAGHDAGGELIAGGWRVLPESAGAGLWTTPGDLCRLACDVMAAWSGGSGQLLDKETARLMVTAQVGGRGLGWERGQVRGALYFGHGGDNIGYKCRLVGWPERGLGVAVMTNADDGGRLIPEVVDAIERQYGWPSAVDAEDQAGVVLAREALAALAGEYGGEGQPRLAITVGDRGLTLDVVGQPPLSLRAVSATTFIADVVNTEARFVLAVDGRASALVLRQYGQELTLQAKK